MQVSWDTIHTEATELTHLNLPARGQDAICNHVFTSTLQQCSKEETTFSSHWQGEKIPSLPESPTEQGSRRTKTKPTKQQQQKRTAIAFLTLKISNTNFKYLSGLETNGCNSQHDTFPFKDIIHWILNLKQIYILKSCP